MNHVEIKFYGKWIRLPRTFQDHETGALHGCLYRWEIRDYDVRVIPEFQTVYGCR